MVEKKTIKIMMMIWVLKKNYKTSKMILNFVFLSNCLISLQIYHVIRV